MKVVVQRVDKASCEVGGKLVSKIDKGLLLFVGFTQGDNLDTVKKMASKVLNLRIFDDSNGVMNLAIDKHNMKILSVSQFTLYADTKKGNRPSYKSALNHREAKLLFDKFNEELATGITIETGVFREDMKIGLVNDGPITIILEV